MADVDVTESDELGFAEYIELDHFTESYTPDVGIATIEISEASVPTTPNMGKFWY